MEVLKVNFGDFKLNVSEYPDAIQYPDGRILYKKGIGLYPYSCINKDKYPNAMIYEDSGAWTCMLIK